MIFVDSLKVAGMLLMVSKHETDTWNWHASVSPLKVGHECTQMERYG